MKSEEHFQVGSQLKFKLDPDNTNCNTPINHVTGQIFLLIELTVKDKIYKVHKLLTSISRAT